MQLPATTTPVPPTTTARALTLPTDTTATATALAIPTEMAYATSLRWADATMHQPATTTPVPPTTTVRATYAADGYDCDGNCLSDADGDGIMRRV